MSSQLEAYLAGPLIFGNSHLVLLLGVRGVWVGVVLGSTNKEMTLMTWELDDKGAGRQVDEPFEFVRPLR